MSLPGVCHDRGATARLVRRLMSVADCGMVGALAVSDWLRAFDCIAATIDENDLSYLSYVKVDLAMRYISLLQQPEFESLPLVQPGERPALAFAQPDIVLVVLRDVRSVMQIYGRPLTCIRTFVRHNCQRDEDIVRLAGIAESEAELVSTSLASLGVEPSMLSYRAQETGADYPPSVYFEFAAT